MTEQAADAYTAGSGPPLVLLHGINASWRIWSPILPLLESHYEVHALTLPGHRGAAPLPVGGKGGAVELADALEARLDESQIPRAHLVGNSLGGWLALELAQRGRAVSVVAFSPAGAWRRQRDLNRLVRLFRFGAAMNRRPSLPKLLARPRVRRVLLRSVAARADRIPTPDLAGMLADMEACTILDGLLDSIRSTGSVSALTVAADCPVRIAWPIRDRTIPFKNYGVPYVDLLPQAELVRLEGVGHVPMFDDPALVARTIIDFTGAHQSA